MSTLHIIFDKNDKLHTDQLIECKDLQVAKLQIQDDMEALDIYNVAKNLAKLLLENLN